MYILKKLFKLRDQGDKSTDTDKPFLEHLEDLRDVVVKVVITLVIATIGCYVFRSSLMDVLRKPIEEVWTQAQETKLPEAISPSIWEQAKTAADATRTFTPQQQEAFYTQFEDEKLRDYAQTATYYRAALLIKDTKKRDDFIANFPETDEDTKKLLNLLIEKQPSAALNAKGDVVYMRSLKPTETFMLAIKLSLFAGVIISFPLLLYFILQFILPGLKDNERKALWPAMLIGFGLFLIGVLFCYFVVLPKALDFFYSYSAGLGVENEWRIGDYITFTTQFTLIFGLAFELPVVVMTLVKLGLLSYQTMSNTRSYAVLTIFVVGAIITPTGDALTLSLLALPMYILYEGCIWLAYFNNKKEAAREAKDEADMIAYNERKKGNGEDNDDDDDHDDDPDPTKPTDPVHVGGSKESNQDDDNSIPAPVTVPGKIPTDAKGHLTEDLDDPHAGHTFGEHDHDMFTSECELDSDPFEKRIKKIREEQEAYWAKKAEEGIDDDDHLLDDDYFADGHFNEDHTYEEGDEFDDGELEDFSKSIETIKQKLDGVIEPDEGSDDAEELKNNQQ